MVAEHAFSPVNSTFDLPATETPERIPSPPPPPPPPKEQTGGKDRGDPPNNEGILSFLSDNAMIGFFFIIIIFRVFWGFWDIDSGVSSLLSFLLELVWFRYTGDPVLLKGVW